MPKGVEHRSVTRLLKVFREVMRGREIVEGLRYADCLSARTQPPPHIPDGPYHKTSKVYYYTRDARRIVKPPIEVNLQKQIEAGGSISVKPRISTPGKAYQPDEE